MGRHSQGYQLRKPRTPGHCWSVRYRIDGERREVSTGERDRAKAERAAREIYASAVRGESTSTAASAAFELTAGVTAEWLAELPLRGPTVELYEKYSGFWLARLRRLSDAAIASYVRKRLKEVQGKSVRSELSALRSLVRWLVEQRYIEEAPAIPSLGHSDIGTPSKRGSRTAAPELTDAEVQAVLRRLPDKSNRDGFWVRHRCELLWETGLRPTTVDALSVPEHWAPGSKSLNVTADIDKEGFARELPLSPRALAILKRCAPKDGGVIFGAHRYDHFVKPAAAAALTATKAKVFTSQHLRSAFATNRLEQGGELPGVQYLLGHRRMSTTAIYLRPTFRAAKSALGAKKRGR